MGLIIVYEPVIFIVREYITRGLVDEDKYHYVDGIKYYKEYYNEIVCPDCVPGTGHYCKIHKGGEDEVQSNI